MTFTSHARAFRNPPHAGENPNDLTDNDIAFISAHIADPNTRILDYGCGDGRTVLALRGRGFLRVVGVDMSKDKLEIARSSARRHKIDVSFVESDPQRTPFGDKCFDVILMLGSVFGRSSGSENDTTLLREARRLLSPGGTLYLSFADRDWFKTHSESYCVYPVKEGILHRDRQLTSDGNCLLTRVLVTDSGNHVVSDRTSLEWLHSESDILELAHCAGFAVPEFERAASHVHMATAPHPIAICYAR